MKRTTIIKRLRRSCAEMNHSFKISKSIHDKNVHGECYITNSEGVVVGAGSVHDIAKARHLILKDEVIDG